MLGAKAVSDPDQIIPAIPVVLIKQANLCVGLCVENLPSVNVRFSLEVREAGNCPWVMLRIAKHCGSGGDEQLRHLIVVEVGANRGISDRAQAPENEGDLFLFDEAAGLFDSLCRLQTIVQTDQIDLSAIDASQFIDHLEIR